ncbi:hypothetical protein SHJG_p1145 (plasmid) [Streptomyces hygroscopicus subsp. jinggangensis 5008]|nr:hypothetical protein SHJG_p1145 [Streptomyces hygroscopicus subsp. jinggangensis 5008]AGF68430.1 hypothetical protein SHJGH_p1145 [Streptomyces hygroscopicus subsp. jinggangensis TL01]
MVISDLAHHVGGHASRLPDAVVGRC